MGFDIDAFYRTLLKRIYFGTVKRAGIMDNSFLFVCKGGAGFEFTYHLRLKADAGMLWTTFLLVGHHEELSGLFWSIPKQFRWDLTKLNGIPRKRAFAHFPVQSNALPPVISSEEELKTFALQVSAYIENTYNSTLKEIDSFSKLVGFLDRINQLAPVNKFTLDLLVLFLNEPDMFPPKSPSPIPIVSRLHSYLYSKVIEKK